MRAATRGAFASSCSLDIVPARDLGDARVRVVSGDLADPALIERTLTRRIPIRFSISPPS